MTINSMNFCLRNCYLYLGYERIINKPEQRHCQIHQCEHSKIV
jgi:hypothetical protein